jgi:tRNA (guanine37-N1)-methyltransferase
MVVFHIFTIFPDSLPGYLNSSIVKRAVDKKLVKIKIYDFRKWGEGKHKKVDERPFGGGPGMVIKAEPVFKAIVSSVKNKKARVVIFNPFGKQFEQKNAIKWAMPTGRQAKKEKEFVLICGRYEGIDERLKKILKDAGYKNIAEVSVGPYVLTGGELPAMIVVDAVSRHIPGVLGKYDSLEELKGSYKVYTRPEVIKIKNKKYAVPKVLLSGDHKKIEEWRKANQ